MFISLRQTAVLVGQRFNSVSDSPLLLLIVSISVPAEKWSCCGQTEAIDLPLVPDLPGASREG